MKLRHAAAIALVGWPRFLRGKIDWGLIVSLAFVELILFVVAVVVLFSFVSWLFPDW